MHNLKYYFKSIYGFNALLTGLARRFSEAYYRRFSPVVKNKIKAEVSQLDVISFRNKITHTITISDHIDKNLFDETKINELINESIHIVSGYVDLLGSGLVLLEPKSWHVDFKTGYEWPKGKFFRDYDQEALHSSCDVKVPRELSRSHHILKTALAYHLTNDEKYARFCVQQINEWIDDNPLMFSINWGCTMDVAIRSINWIWAVRLLINSKSCTDGFLKKVMLSLYEHGWYIYRNPEKGQAYNHNHYLSDLAGQIYLGILFDDLKEPKKWLEEAKHEFFKEMRLQILPSGMSYERSTNYNRLVLELFVWPIILLKTNGHEIPFDIWARLENMFEFVMHILKPDGNTPVIGDQDNGRLLIFGPEEGLDYRYLLSLGAVLFKRTDFKTHSNGFNLYAAFSGVEKAEQIFRDLKSEKHILNSRYFKDIGIAVLRNQDNYLLFNASGMAKYPEYDPGSHTHSDLLSFELFAFGRTFLIDPGTYVYSADIEQRMLFRSTKMHNTVTVDGLSQNNLFANKPWGFERNAIPSIIDWISDSKKDLIAAHHDGYSRLEYPIIHKRTLEFNKTDELWTIVDVLSGSGTHHFEWFFHFDIGIDFEILDFSITTTNKDGKNIIMEFDKHPNLTLKKENSYVSKSYGCREDSLVLVASLKSVAPLELKIKIFKSR